MEISSSGLIKLKFKNNGDIYSWNKVTTCLRNVFSEGRYLEHYGDLIIENEVTKETAKLTFKVILFSKRTKKINQQIINK